MDDTWVDELAQLPGLSAAVARNVAAQFRTPDALAAASVQELTAVPGVGPRLAETLQSFATSTRPVMFGLDLTSAPPVPDGFATAKISRRAHRLLDDLIYFVRREHDMQIDKQDLLGLIIEAFAESNRLDLEASGWKPWGE